MTKNRSPPDGASMKFLPYPAFAQYRVTATQKGTSMNTVNKTTVATTNPSPASDLPPRFDWAGYLRHAKYRDVNDLSCQSSAYPPSMTSPDGRWLYLASQDIAVAVNEVGMLRNMLDIVLHDLRTEINGISWSCHNVYKHEIDYIAVWRHLDALGALPEDYHFPEHYIELAWRDRKTAVQPSNDAAGVRS